MQRQGPAYLLAAAAIFATALTASCVNDENKVRALFEQKPGIDVADSIESFMSQGGVMKARLTAPKMHRYQDTLPRIEFPNSVHVDFYDSSMQVRNKVDARFARYLETRNRIFLQDSVRVTNVEGDTLFCHELWWDQASEKFSTDKPVRIYRPGTIINGVGLSAPQDFKTFTVFQITNSILRVSDPGFTVDSTAGPDSARAASPAPR